MELKYMDSVVETIDKLITNGFPKSTILYGEEGSGRKSICKYIADRLNIELREVADLSGAYDFVNQTLLMVQYNRLSNSDIQSLLKVLEEPPELCTIVIIAETQHSTISMIRNRCVPINMPKYSPKELMDFTDSELVANCCGTPGLAKKLTEETVKSIMDLCSLIIAKMSVASLSNSLQISDRFNLDAETTDKFDVSVFCRIMPTVVLDYYSSHSISFYQARLIMVETEELGCEIHRPSYNKRQLFDSYIISLKEILST